ncbi:uncharacterized protein LOC135500005 isoform X2 [Lineus longissimus]|uniref:uncharacterized protein LOC135500005 isoform X2 n=1 Tax=Lineus longissimus TaxID=88925 RepID=UPI002B4C51F4
MADFYDPADPTDGVAEDVGKEPIASPLFSNTPRQTRSLRRSKDVTPKADDSGPKISFSIKSAPKIIPVEDPKNKPEEEAEKPEPKPVDRKLTIGSVRSNRLKRNIVLPRNTAIKTKQELLSEAAKARAEKSGDDVTEAKKDDGSLGSDVRSKDDDVEGGSGDRLSGDDTSACVWKARQLAGDSAPPESLKDKTRSDSSRDRADDDRRDRKRVDRDRSKSPPHYRGLRSRGDRSSPHRSPDREYSWRDSRESDRRRTRSSNMDIDSRWSDVQGTDHDRSARRSYRDDDNRSGRDTHSRDQRSPSPQYRRRTRRSIESERRQSVENDSRKMKQKSESFNDKLSDSVFSGNPHESESGRGRQQSDSSRERRSTRAEQAGRRLRSEKSLSPSPERRNVPFGKYGDKAQSEVAIVAEKGKRLVAYSPEPSSPLPSKVDVIPVKASLKLVDYSPDRATPDRTAVAPTPEKMRPSSSRRDRIASPEVEVIRNEEASIGDEDDEIRVSDAGVRTRRQKDRSKSERSPEVVPERQTRRSLRVFRDRQPDEQVESEEAPGRRSERQSERKKKLKVDGDDDSEASELKKRGRGRSEEREGEVNLKGSPERRARQTSLDRRTRQTSPDRRTRQTSPNRRMRQKSPDRRSRRDSPDKKTKQKSLDRKNLRESPDRRSPKESPDRRSQKESPDRRDQKVSPDKRVKQKSPHSRSPRVSPDRSGQIDSPDRRRHHRSQERRNKQISPHWRSPKESLDRRSYQDSPESRSQKDSRNRHSQDIRGKSTSPERHGRKGSPDVVRYKESPNKSSQDRRGLRHDDELQESSSDDDTERDHRTRKVKERKSTMDVCPSPDRRHKDEEKMLTRKDQHSSRSHVEKSKEDWSPERHEKKGRDRSRSPNLNKRRTRHGRRSPDQEKVGKEGSEYFPEIGVKYVYGLSDRSGTDTTAALPVKKKEKSLAKKEEKSPERQSSRRRDADIPDELSWKKKEHHSLPEKSHSEEEEKEFAELPGKKHQDETSPKEKDRSRHARKERHISPDGPVLLEEYVPKKEQHSSPDSAREERGHDSRDRDHEEGRTRKKEYHRSHEKLHRGRKEEDTSPERGHKHEEKIKDRKSGKREKNSISPKREIREQEKGLHEFVRDIGLKEESGRFEKRTKNLPRSALDMHIDMAAIPLPDSGIIHESKGNEESPQKPQKKKHERRRSLSPAGIVGEDDSAQLSHDAPRRSGRHNEIEKRRRSRELSEGKEPSDGQRRKEKKPDGDVSCDLDVDDIGIKDRDDNHRSKRQRTRTFDPEVEFSSPVVKEKMDLTSPVTVPDVAIQKQQEPEVFSIETIQSKPIAPIVINMPLVKPKDLNDTSQRTHSSIAFTVKAKPSRISTNLKAFADEEVNEEPVVTVPQTQAQLDVQIAKFLAETQTPEKIEAKTDDSHKDDTRDRRRSRRRSPSFERRDRSLRDRRGRRPSWSPDRRRRRSASPGWRRSGSRDRRGGSRDRQQGAGRERQRSRSRDRWGSGSRDRRRSGSRDRWQARSRDRRRSGSRDRSAGSRNKRAESRERPIGPRDRRRSVSRGPVGSRDRRRSGSGGQVGPRDRRRSGSRGRAGPRDRRRSGSKEKERSKAESWERRSSGSGETENIAKLESEGSSIPPSGIKERLKSGSKEHACMPVRSASQDRKSKSREGSVASNRSGSRDRQPRSESIDHRSCQRSTSRERHSLSTRGRQRSTSRGRQRSASGDRQRSPGRGRHRSTSRGRQISASRGRQRSTSRGRQRSTSRGRQRSTSRGRRRSTSRCRQRSTSRSRQRSTSRGRQRSTSRGRQRSTSRGRQRSTSRGRQRSSSRERNVRRQSDRDRRRSPSFDRRNQARRMSPSWERRRSVSSERQQSPSRDRRGRAGSRDRRAGSFERWFRQSPFRGYRRDRRSGTPENRWPVQKRSPRYRRSVSQERRGRSTSPRRSDLRRRQPSPSPGKIFPAGLEVDEEVFDSEKVNAELDLKEQQSEFDVFKSMAKPGRLEGSFDRSGHDVNRHLHHSGVEDDWARQKADHFHGGRFQNKDDSRYQPDQDSHNRRDNFDDRFKRFAPRDQYGSGFGEHRFDEEERGDRNGRRHIRREHGPEIERILGHQNEGSKIHAPSDSFRAHSYGDSVSDPNISLQRPGVPKSSQMGSPPGLNLANIPLPGLPGSPNFSLPGPLPPVAPGPPHQLSTMPGPAHLPQTMPGPPHQHPIAQGHPHQAEVEGKGRRLQRCPVSGVHRIETLRRSPGSATLPYSDNNQSMDMEISDSNDSMMGTEGWEAPPPPPPPRGDIHVQEVSSTQGEIIQVISAIKTESTTKPVSVIPIKTLPAVTHHTPDSSIPEADYRTAKLSAIPLNVLEHPTLLRTDSDDADAGSATPVQDELPDEESEPVLPVYPPETIQFLPAAPAAMGHTLVQAEVEKYKSVPPVGDQSHLIVGVTKNIPGEVQSKTEAIPSVADKISFKFKNVRKVQGQWDLDKPRQPSKGLITVPLTPMSSLLNRLEDKVLPKSDANASVLSAFQPEPVESKLELFRPLESVLPAKEDGETDRVTPQVMPFKEEKILEPIPALSEVTDQPSNADVERANVPPVTSDVPAPVIETAPTRTRNDNIPEETAPEPQYLANIPPPPPQVPSEPNRLHVTAEMDQGVSPPQPVFNQELLTTLAPEPALDQGIPVPPEENFAQDVSLSSSYSFDQGPPPPPPPFPGPFPNFPGMPPGFPGFLPPGFRLPPPGSFHPPGVFGFPPRFRFPMPGFPPGPPVHQQTEMLNLDEPPPPPPALPEEEPKPRNRSTRKSRWGPEVSAPEQPSEPVQTDTAPSGFQEKFAKAEAVRKKLMSGDQETAVQETKSEIWMPPEPSEPAPSESSVSTPTESIADSTSATSLTSQGYSGVERIKMRSLPPVLQNLMRMHPGEDSRSPDTGSAEKSSSESDDEFSDGDTTTPRRRRKSQQDGDTESNEDTPSRRRSTRIKSIEQKKVKEKEEEARRERIRRLRMEREEQERKEKEEYIRRREAQCQEEEVNFIKPSSPSAGTAGPFVRPGAVSPKGDTLPKAENIKKRWRKYCEIEFGGEVTPALPPSGLGSTQDGAAESPSSTTSIDGKSENGDSKKVRLDARQPIFKLFEAKHESVGQPVPPGTESEAGDVPPLPPSPPPPLPPVIPETTEKPPYFEPVPENIYLSERKWSKEQKEAKRMVCDCTTCKEDRLLGIPPCGDDCLNRMLFIECGSRCPCNEKCTNKRFQRREYSVVKPFKTESKGWGLTALDDLDESQFVMEYVGEVLDYKKFKQRCKEYDLDSSGPKHYYFMALNADEVIDATLKGNISRFINHSCDPNCQTQKWTVNGQLRIGFFTKRKIRSGEEITFDYQFERYGKEAQKCYCGAENCRGFIGADKRTPLKILDKVAKDFGREKEKKKKKKEREIFDDLLLDDEIEKMASHDGMKTKAHVLQLARLMVRSENNDHRLALLEIMKATKEPACLRLFLDYHGLSLMWSWMASLGSGSRNLKLQILSTLKILPVTNKTILQDSKVMGVVQKWAAELAMPESSSGETDTERAGSETPQRSTDSTQKVDNSDISDIEFTKPDESYEKMPHKKRKLFQHIKETDDNSSDSDSSKVSGIVNVSKVAVASEQGTESQASSLEGAIEEENKTDDVTSESLVKKIKLEESPTDSDVVTPDESVQSDNTKIEEDVTEDVKPDLEDGEIVEVKKETTVADIASELLESWGSLKDLFKIPKKEQHEERKRTEKELDDRDRDHYRDDYYERDRYRDRDRYYDRSRDRDFDRYRDRDRDRHRDRYDRKRSRYSESPDRGDDRRAGGSRDKRRSSVSHDDERVPRKFNKLDPSLAKLSKKERREMFEAQVKAQDEAAETLRQQEEYMQQQIQQMMEQGLFSYDPNTGQFIPGPGLADIQLGFDPSQMDPNQMDPNQMGPGNMQQMAMGMMMQGGPMGPPMDPSQGQMDPSMGNMPMGPMDPSQGNMPMPMDPSQGSMPMGMMNPSQGPMGPMDPSQGPMGPMDPSQGQMLDGSGVPMDPAQVQMDPTQGQFNQQGPGAMGSMMGPNGPMGPGPMGPMGQMGPPFMDPSQQMMFPGGGPPGSNFPMRPPFMPPQAPPFMQQNQPPFMMGPNGPMMPNQPMFNQSQGAMGGPPVSMMGQGTPMFQQNVTTSSAGGDRPTLEQRWQQVQQNMPGIEPEPQPEKEEEDLPPPPPSPPKPKKQKLPPNWKSAKDAEGKTYYYHSITKQTQWDAPTWDGAESETRPYSSPAMDTPPPFARSKRHKTTTAAADTSSEDAKRCKESFRTKMSSYIVHCLNPFRKPECKLGRISTTEDFKHLARKLTHAVLSKELRYCRHPEDLEVNENVKAKAKEFVRKYMSKFGSTYKKAHSPINM